MGKCLLSLLRFRGRKKYLLVSAQERRRLNPLIASLRIQNHARGRKKSVLPQMQTKLADWFRPPHRRWFFFFFNIFAPFSEPWLRHMTTSKIFPYSYVFGRSGHFVLPVMEGHTHHVSAQTAFIVVETLFLVLLPDALGKDSVSIALAVGWESPLLLRINYPIARPSIVSCADICLIVCRNRQFVTNHDVQTLVLFIFVSSSSSHDASLTSAFVRRQ